MGLSHEETCELVRRARAGEAEALDELVRAHLWVVGFQRRRLRLSRYPDVVLDDLYQEGVLGLIEAAKSFDPMRNVKFSGFAGVYVRRFLLAWLWSNASIIRLSHHVRPNKLGKKVGRTPWGALMREEMRRCMEQARRPMPVLGDPDRYFELEAPAPAEAMAEDEARLVREAVAALPDEYRDCIEACYLDPEGRLSVAKWVRSRMLGEQAGERRHRVALHKLREMLGPRAAAFGREVD